MARAVAPTSFLCLLVLPLACSEADDSRGREALSVQKAEDFARIEHVVLISIDTLRADRLGVYGRGGRVSPRLDAFAERAAVFLRAVASNPITLPSHATMFTGLHPTRHGVHDNTTFQLAPEHVTLAERLKAEGWTTLGVVGSVALDAQFGIAQGFDVFDDAIEKPTVQTDEYFADRRASTVTDRAIEMLREHRGSRIFLFAHYYDPHRDWNAPLEFRKKFPNDGYAAEIAYTDAEVGRLLDALADLGLAERSLVIVTSDHGESLGAFDEVGHVFFIYQATQHVPLLIHAPGMQRRRDIRAVAGGVDITPTVLGALGLAEDPSLQGLDLSAVWRSANAETPERFVYAESVTPTKFACNPLMALVGDRWKYIHSSRAELFDLDADPYEAKDRIAEEPERAARMRTALYALLEERATAGAGHYEVDEATRAGLEALGYLGNDAEDSLEIRPDRDDPQDCIQLFNKYASLFKLTWLGRFQEAREVAKTLRKLRPDMAEIYHLLGLISLLEHKWREAITHLRFYLALAEAEGIAASRQAMARGRLAIAFLEFEDADAAVAEIDRAVALDPGNAGLRFDRGLMMRRLGNRDRAIADFEQVLQMEPERRNAKEQLAALAAANSGEPE